MNTRKKINTTKS